MLRFCEGKRAVLMVEEGQPNFIEQNIATILRQAGATTALHGKDMLPMAGEYTAAEMLKGARAFLERYGRIEPAVRPALQAAKVIPAQGAGGRRATRVRPAFAPAARSGRSSRAMKLVERELGPHHVSADIGCHLFSILPPFNLGNTTMGYGLGRRGAAALNAPGGASARSA